eukprot:760297-Hanusia_phi.AAC.5
MQAWLLASDRVPQINSMEEIRLYEAAYLLNEGVVHVVLLQPAPFILTTGDRINRGYVASVEMIIDKVQQESSSISHQYHLAMAFDACSVTSGQTGDWGKSGSKVARENSSAGDRRVCLSTVSGEFCAVDALIFFKFDIKFDDGDVGTDVIPLTAIDSTKCSLSYIRGNEVTDRASWYRGRFDCWLHDKLSWSKRERRSNMEVINFWSIEKRGGERRRKKTGDREQRTGAMGRGEEEKERRQGIAS